MILQGGDLLSILPAGLPNITAVNTGGSGGSVNSSGAAYKDRMATSFASGSYQLTLRSFDASKSNAIYGASQTVQPPALSLTPQIKY